MDERGHERIVGALQSAGIQAEVLPAPKPGEDLPYVTVVYEDGPPFVLASLLNALAAEGLMQGVGKSNFRDPQLEFLAQHHVFATFQDRTAKPQSAKNGFK